jgi:DNA polymerase III delta subunit
MVAGVLTRELRALIGIKEQAQVGSLEAALQGARIWPKRKALISRVVQRLSLDELQALHGAIRAVDAIVKGVEPGEPWGVMANVSMRLSGHRISVPFPK